MRYVPVMAMLAAILPLLALPAHAADAGNFTVHMVELPQDATSLAMSGDRVAVLTRDGLALLYRISGGDVGLESRLNLSALHPQLLALQGSSLLVCGEGGTLYLLDPASGRVLSRLTPRPAQTPLEGRQRSCVYLAGGVAVYNDSVFFVTLSPGFSMVRGFISNKELAGSWGAEIEAATTYIGMVYAYTRVESPDTIIAYAARTPQGSLVVGVYSLLVANSAKTVLADADSVCSLKAPRRQPSYIAALAAQNGAVNVVLYRPPRLLYEPGRGEAEIVQGGTLPPGIDAAAAAWLDNSTLLVATTNGTLYTYNTENTRLEEVEALGDTLPPCAARISVDPASGAAALAAGKRLYIVLPGGQAAEATQEATHTAATTTTTETTPTTTRSPTATPATATTKTEATKTLTTANTGETAQQTPASKTPTTTRNVNEKTATNTATHTAREKKATETATRTEPPPTTRQTAGQRTATAQSPAPPSQDHGGGGIALAAAAALGAAAAAILRRR